MVASGYAGMWALGVARQHERLSAEPDQYGDEGVSLDALNYVICLRNFIRSAHLVHDALHPHDLGYVAYWLKDFERRCPSVVSARNFLEHFDEYVLGLGREQRGRPRTPLRIRLVGCPKHGDWKPSN